MILSFVTMVSMAVAGALAQSPAPAPDGRWDGIVTFDSLKVPFTLNFETNGKKLTGSFVNGDSRVTSTEGTIEGTSVRLAFGASGTRMEGEITDDQLKGTFKSGRQMRPFMATKFCSCGPVGDAGPDISGAWEVPGSNMRLTIRRNGDDTLAAISRPSSELSPLAGRFDGLTFKLTYFDGVRAAVLEIEEHKEGGLALKLSEPGTEVGNYRAIKATNSK